MQIELRIVLIVITLIYLFFILKSMKNKKMQISFSLFWIFTGIILLVAAIAPNIFKSISDILGFETTANMIFCITIFLAFYLIFNLTIMLTKENNKSTKLIQEISLLKNRVEELEKNYEEKKDENRN